MRIPVLIESAPNGGYQARGGEPFPLVVSGTTPQDALEEFKNCVAAQLHGGAQLASVEIPANEHPWTPFAGMFSEDDPLVVQWLEAIRSERDQVEESA